MDRQRLGATILRVAIAGTMVIHGVTRVTVGGVGGFGDWLGTRGLPFGVALAWILTAVEIAGGLALASGRWVRALCAWFAAQLIAGILLVHAPEGWFVVGAGRNGMEYSVILIVGLAVIALQDRGGRRR
jgi:putative oxidoreductase